MDFVLLLEIKNGSVGAEESKNQRVHRQQHRDEDLHHGAQGRAVESAYEH